MGGNTQPARDPLSPGATLRRFGLGGRPDPGDALGVALDRRVVPVALALHPLLARVDGALGAHDLAVGRTLRLHHRDQDLVDDRAHRQRQAVLAHDVPASHVAVVGDDVHLVDADAVVIGVASAHALLGAEDDDDPLAHLGRHAHPAVGVHGAHEVVALAGGVVLA